MWAGLCPPAKVPMGQMFDEPVGRLRPSLASAGYEYFYIRHCTIKGFSLVEDVLRANRMKFSSPNKGRLFIMER